MTYIALEDVSQNVERVSARADAGGHPAPESKLRDIHRKSLANLAIALAEIDSVQVYDNSRIGREPELVMETERGEVTYLAEKTPGWLEKVCGEPTTRLPTRSERRRVGFHLQRCRTD